jgi:hypothetical protein
MIRGDKVNLGQIKNKAIQIIREYSNNGALIGSNDNADYLLSMNGFINDAQFELAAKKPIVKKYVFNKPDSETSNFKRYVMPADFAGFRELKKDDFKFTDFEWEDRTLVVPARYEGEYTMWYCAYPAVLDESSSDSAQLEVDLECQQVIPYYAAGHVIIDENPSLSKFFLDEFERKKRLIKTAAEVSKVVNLYGGFDCGEEI